MKILLLGFVRIAHMPYMYDYVRLLSDSNELHLISWNRNGKPDAEVPRGIEKSYVFEGHVEDDDPIWKKLPKFARFRKFALDIILSEQYDKIAVLHSTPGITILDLLTSEYKGRYLLDYRDVSHENLGIYRKLILRLSQNAGAVVASSPTYFKYLDNASEVHLKHNLLASDYVKDLEIPVAGKPIRIRFWGMIRHEKSNLALIDAFGGDDRFELHYHGREEEVANHLKAYAAARGYGNVAFHGAYFAPQRAEFAAGTDLIHNVYDNDFQTCGAMSNKYYDALQYRIPLICSAGSTMGDEVEAKGLGIAVRCDDCCLADRVAEYFLSYDRAAFAAACEKELASVLADNAHADKAICRLFGA